MNNKNMLDEDELKLSPEQCLMVCDSLGIYSDFFDPDSEEYILLMDNNPELLKAYEILFTLGNSNDD